MYLDIWRVNVNIFIWQIFLLKFKIFFFVLFVNNIIEAARYIVVTEKKKYYSASFASYSLLPDSGAQTPQPIPDIGRLFLQPQNSNSSLDSRQDTSSTFSQFYNFTCLKTKLCLGWRSTHSIQNCLNCKLRTF